ncbi:hypothetical protein [Candidatus Uabimicrobium sp. HlEnr_7]|uniref:hypothetical protein n=1 Tax=Candidatus Uabimicrobium helgolandensis TaxID=3095367 RepID=UPI0035588446
MKFFYFIVFAIICSGCFVLPKEVAERLKWELALKEKKKLAALDLKEAARFKQHSFITTKRGQAWYCISIKDGNKLTKTSGMFIEFKQVSDNTYRYTIKSGGAGFNGKILIENNKFFILDTQGTAKECERCEQLVNYFCRSKKFALENENLLLHDDNKKFVVTLSRVSI